jgi:hypothetical protein
MAHESWAGRPWTGRVRNAAGLCSERADHHCAKNIPTRWIAQLTEPQAVSSPFFVEDSLLCLLWSKGQGQQTARVPPPRQACTGPARRGPPVPSALQAVPRIRRILRGRQIVSLPWRHFSRKADEDQQEETSKDAATPNRPSSEDPLPKTDSPEGGERHSATPDRAKLPVARPRSSFLRTPGAMAQPVRTLPGPAPRSKRRSRAAGSLFRTSPAPLPTCEWPEVAGPRPRSP